MKKAKVAAGIAIVLFAGIVIMRLTNSEESPRKGGGNESSGSAVKITRPQRGDISASSFFLGDISGIEQATVYSEVPGRLNKYLVSEGQQVEKDQVVAHVERDITGMDYELHRVRAPVNGTVTRLYHSSGDTLSQQTPLAVVAKIDRVKASFYIPEREISFIEKGNPVSFKTDAPEAKVFHGKITRISLSLDRESRAAYAEALFENPDSLLRPGMFASLQVTYSRRQDVLLIPESAVIRKAGDDEYIVFTAEEGKAVKKPVETGYTQNDKMHIISGLNENDMVIIEGQHFIEEGDKIRIVE